MNTTVWIRGISKLQPQIWSSKWHMENIGTILRGHKMFNTSYGTGQLRRSAEHGSVSSYGVGVASFSSKSGAAALWIVQFDEVAVAGQFSNAWGCESHWDRTMLSLLNLLMQLKPFEVKLVVPDDNPNVPKASLGLENQLLNVVLLSSPTCE